MKRRQFLLHSTGVALLGALPVGVAAAMRGTLLDDPLAWIGTRFDLADGCAIELAAVEELPGDGRSTQLRLQFRTRAGSTPCEGLHALRNAWSEQALFLQQGRDGPVACINRLHAHA